MARVLMFGSDSVALATARALHASKQGIGRWRGVVSHLEIFGTGTAPQRRGSGVVDLPAHAFAKANNIPFHAIPMGNKSLKSIEPKRFLEALPQGAINMHPSLLPKYRGAAPIEHALMAGDSETGVSIIEIHPDKFDVGAVLYQERVPLDPHVQCPQLTEQLADKGAEAVMHVLENLQQVRTKGWTQPNMQAAIDAPKIKAEHGLIEWGHATRQSLYNLWRAVGSGVGVYSFLTTSKGQRIRVRLVTLDVLRLPSGTPPAADAPAGTVWFDVHSKGLFIKCTDGWLCCTELVLDSGKHLSGEQFANGYKLRQQTLVLAS